MIDLIAARTDTAEDTFWEPDVPERLFRRHRVGRQADGRSRPPGRESPDVRRRRRHRPVAISVLERNTSINADTDTRGVVTAANIQSYMNSTAIGLKRNSDGVNMIIADSNYYLSYLQSLQAIQRITTDGGTSGGIGYTALKYFGAGKSVDVILDGGKGGQCPANTMYFLNTDYFAYRPHRDRNFKVIGGERTNVNQDAIVKLMAWAGNMTISNPSPPRRALAVAGPRKNQSHDDRHHPVGHDRGSGPIRSTVRSRDQNLVPPFKFGEVAAGDAESEFVYVSFAASTPSLTLQQGQLVAWDNNYNATLLSTAAARRAARASAPSFWADATAMRLPRRSP